MLAFYESTANNNDLSGDYGTGYSTFLLLICIFAYGSRVASYGTGAIIIPVPCVLMFKVKLF